MTLRLISWVTISLFSFAALAITNTPDAFKVSLNQDGLNVLAAEIKQSHLPNIVNEAMPDMAEEGPLGVDVTLSGVRYSVDFDSLSFVGKEGKLASDVGIRSIRIHVDTLKMEKDLLVTVGSTCTNTDITLGKARPLHVTTDLVPSIADKKLKVFPEGLSFAVAEDNYEVVGPNECSGVLFTGSIVKWVVNKVLNSSREKIQTQMERKIAEMVPVLEAKMNEMLYQDFPVRVPKNPLIPEKKVVLTPYPYRVSVSSQGVDFHLGVNLSANTWRPPYRRMSWAPFNALALGSAGVNPQMFSDFFKTLFPKGTDYVEVTNFSAAKELLTSDVIGQLLPDILEAPLTDTQLRAFVSIVETPVFAADANLAKVRVSVPKMLMKLQAQLEGVWRDYFIFTMRVDSGALLEITDGALSFQLPQENFVSLTGQWADGYQPKSDKFEQQTAEELGVSLMQFMHEIGPLVEVHVPVVNIGNKQVTVVEPTVAAPFVQTKILALD